MTKPTQIRIPPDLLAQIDKAAAAANLTRTAWLLKAAQAQLGLASESATAATDIRPDAPAEPRLLLDAKPYKCPVCNRGYSASIRCPCSNRLTVRT